LQILMFCTDSSKQLMDCMWHFKILVTKESLYWI